LIFKNISLLIASMSVIVDHLYEKIMKKKLKKFGKVNIVQKILINLDKKNGVITFRAVKSV